MRLPPDLRESLAAVKLNPPPDNTPELDDWLLHLRDSDPEAYQMVVGHATYATPEVATERAERAARKQSALRGVVRRHLWKKTSVGQAAPNRKLIGVLAVVVALGFFGLLGLVGGSPGPEQAGAPPEPAATAEQPAAAATPAPRVDLPAIAPTPSPLPPGNAAGQIGAQAPVSGPALPPPNAAAMPLLPPPPPPMATAAEPFPPAGAVAAGPAPAPQSPPGMAVYRPRAEAGGQDAGIGAYRPNARAQQDGDRQQGGLGTYRPAAATPTPTERAQAGNERSAAQAEVPEAVRRIMPGARIDGRLVTGVVIQEGGSVPAVVESEGLVWIGNASLVAGRVQIALDRAIAGNTVLPVQAFVLEAATQTPGMSAQITTTSPDVAQTLIAGAMQGLAGYMQAVAQQGQQVVTSGQWAVITQGQAGPWWSYLLGALAGNVPRLTPPADQTRVRIAQVAAGGRVTVLVVGTGAR